MRRYKNLKRIPEPNATYLITTKTKDNYPYFKNEVLCELFIEQLKFLRIIKDFDLYAFCILYDHVHLIVRPVKSENISKLMFSIKKQFAHNANRVLGYNSIPVGAEALPLLRSSDRSAVGQQALADLQSRLFDLHKQLKKSSTYLPKFHWQKSFHDRILTTPKSLENAQKYVLYNYAKHTDEHDYPKYYQYTSLNYEDLVDPIH